MQTPKTKQPSRHFEIIIQQTRKRKLFFDNMKQIRKNILNMDFIQNTKNKQRFQYYIIFHANKNNRFYTVIRC